jgi:hypothetical protein
MRESEAPRIQIPPGFVVRTEAQKAAYDNGFRIAQGEVNGWLRFSSTTARGEIWIGAASSNGPWFLSVNHPGVAAELTAKGERITGPGLVSYAYQNLGELYAAIDQAYRLGVSLPDAPLEQFQKQTAGMPRTTEAERLVVQRVGQDIFREALLAYWGGRCPMTGISDPALLRASHIVPWSECDCDAHRLDVHNGLLLSALWDAAFDAGLVSFTDDGSVLFSPKLTPDGRAALEGASTGKLFGLTAAHGINLRRHRQMHGYCN